MTQKLPQKEWGWGGQGDDKPAFVFFSLNSLQCPQGQYYNSHFTREATCLESHSHHVAGLRLKPRWRETEQPGASQILGVNPCSFTWKTLGNFPNLSELQYPRV